MLDYIKNFYPIKLLRMYRYDRRFENNCNSCFRGVFDSFSAAYASAPSREKLGFDLHEFANLFQDRMTSVHQYDYPIIFWLQKILMANQKLFDLGGHIGLQYYGYQNYITYPERFQWTACDVPNVVAQGKELAAKRNCTNLKFTSDICDAQDSDILFSAGTIQYIESPLLHEALGALSNKPRHLLLNKLPLYDGPGFVTLQNSSVSFVAQYVFNRNEFIQPLLDLGYQLVDSWTVHELSCNIPFFQRHSVKHYSGLYLRL